MGLNRTSNIKEKNCCSNPHVIRSEGDYICQNCGLVYDRILETAADKVYNFDFVHTQILMVQSSNHTRLDAKFDFLGKPIPSYNQMLFRRASRLNNQKCQTKDRLMNNSESILRIILSKFEVSKCTQLEIRNLITKGIKAGLSHYGLESLVLSCVYTVFKSVLHLSLTNILKVYPFNRSKVFDTLRHLDNLNIIDMRKHCIQNKPSDLIEEYLSKMFFNDKKANDQIPSLITRIDKILQIAQKRGLFICGKKPNGYIASIIFLLVNEYHEIDTNMTQKEIAQYCDVTEVTLRSRAKELRHYLSLNQTSINSIQSSHISNPNLILAKEMNQ